MAGQGIDCLVMQNSNEFLGGYVRWFTDIPTWHGYPITVLFPVDDEMTYIHSGGTPAPPPPPVGVYRGIKKRIARPYFRTMHYTDSMDAGAAVEALQYRGSKVVGLVSKGSMSAAFYEYLRDKLPRVEFIDATDLVDEIKAVKSPEELELTRKAIAIQDAVWGAVPAFVRPGRRECEVRMDIQHLLLELGSEEEQLINAGSAPPGSPARQKASFYQHRILRPGDQFTIMIEINGPGGFYGELGRTICLGEPPAELLKLWDVAREAQLRTAALLKPGARPADVFKAHNDFLTSLGYPPEGRIFAHGQGYDLVERPAIRDDETMVLKANMNIAIHPVVQTETSYAFCCDNYLIGENGAERLHKTPLEVFVAPW